MDRVVDVVGDALRNEQCILFLGAGVHAPPPEGSAFSYPPEQRPPIGKALSRELAAACDFEARFAGEDPDSLQRVALAYEIDSSRGRLVDAIAGAVAMGRAPSPMLSALAQLDFPIVITTNYDQLLGRALQATGKQPRIAVYNPGATEPPVDFRNATAPSPVIYKLHGDIAHRESLVVTDEDYIQFAMRMSDKDPYDPIPLSLKFYLTGSTTLFVGYSLLDYNLRLLFKALRWKIEAANVPDMYSVDFRPDPLITDVWQGQRRYVKFIAQDVWVLCRGCMSWWWGRSLRHSHR
jgi:SIR2-like domain